MDDDEARRLLDGVIEREGDRALGFVVTGSAARGTMTVHSDLDVYLVLPDDAPPRPISRSRTLDLIPIGVGALEAVPAFGTPGWWQRWSFAWARVERDRTGGRIGEAVLRQATLTAAEQRAVLVDHDRLDGYLNLAYRALKADRAGRRDAARLDGAEAVPWLLDTLFALVGRVRPYNGYLAWELRTHPAAGLAAEVVLRLVDGHLGGDASAIRDGFRLVERLALAWDADAGAGEADGRVLTEVIEGWGEELALLRGG